MKDNTTIGLGVTISVILVLTLVTLMTLMSADIFYFDGESTVLLFSYVVYGLLALSIGMLGILTKKKGTKGGYVILFVTGLVALVGIYLMYYLWWW